MSKHRDSVTGTSILHGSSWQRGPRFDHQLRRLVWSGSIVALVLCLPFLSAARAGGGDTQIGIKAASNWDKYERESTTSFDEDGYKRGFSVGVLASYGIWDRFAIQPEILYATRGGNSVDGGDVYGSYELSYIELPLLARIELLQRGPLAGYILAGPTVSFLLGAELEDSTGRRDIAQFVKGYDFSGVLGVQATYELWPRIMLNVEARYDRGLMDVDSGTDGFSVENRAFLLTVGVGYTIVQGDSDGDMIVNRVDRCRTQAEDKDGFEDLDGCPDEDNDRDRIADATDTCPIKAENYNGVEDKDGCPENDTDGDGIADMADRCPDQKSVGPVSDEYKGCPPWYPDVRIAETRLVLLEPITFDKGKAELTTEHMSTLDKVATVLQHEPRMKLLIEGHADGDGTAQVNVSVSESRARVVAEYLASRGIYRERLVDKGFGEDKPLYRETLKGKTPEEKKQIDENRKQNRRVELLIIQR